MYDKYYCCLKFSSSNSADSSVVFSRWHARRSHRSSSSTRSTHCVRRAARTRASQRAASKPSSSFRCRAWTITTTAFSCWRPPTSPGSLTRPFVVGIEQHTVEYNLCTRTSLSNMFDILNCLNYSNVVSRNGSTYLSRKLRVVSSSSSLLWGTLAVKLTTNKCENLPREQRGLYYTLYTSILILLYNYSMQYC